MRQLKALFLSTCNSGVIYWRIQNFVEAAWRTGLASFQHPLWIKDRNSMQEWQGKLTDGPKYDPLYLRAFVPMIESGCREADVVVFQYVQEEGALELFDSIKTRFPDLPILTEIDDNLLSVPRYNEANMTYDPRSEVRRRALDQIKASDGVIVSTPGLKTVYSEFNDNIHVIPNCIDFGLWNRAKRKSRPGLRIGWAGGGNHEGDVAAIQNAIKNTLKNHPSVKFVFVNGPGFHGLPDFLRNVPGVEHHAIWAPILKYPQMLASMDFDIIISPLVDSAFNRGKSNLKWLEAAALGIPCIASNVGHYAETLRTGDDCVLADDEKEFELALDVLIRDRKRRKDIGKAAHARAMRDFNVDTVVRKYVDCLQSAANIKACGLAANTSTTAADAIPSDYDTSLAIRQELPA